MVKLGSLPPDTIINGLRGTIDFACNKGVLYARGWPRAPQLPRAPKVAAQYSDFGYITEAGSTASSALITAYKALASGTERYWRDYLVTLFYGRDIYVSENLPSDHAFQDTAFDLEAFQ